MPTRRSVTWGAWGAVVVAVAGVLGYELWLAQHADLFLPGPSSAGHYQVELACGACHREPFTDRTVMQDACMDCHGDQLERANDSHPRSKFTDPRNADRVARLDARYCVTCHREHEPERTRPMAVTVPEDFCAHCHQDIGEERPSHEGLAFDSCNDAGCHNFHDNRALYEDFLVEHAGEPVPAERRVPLRTSTRDDAAPAGAPDAPARHRGEAVVDTWRHDAHAAEGVNCSDCHGSGEAWRDTVGIDTCAQCHEAERRGFEQGRHGMRVAVGLDPMDPADARRPMKADAHGRQLTCTSCHGAHAFDVARAAVEACLGCHDDRHSRSYRGSTHHELWQAEQAGEAPAGSGVSCATCHMPRRVERVDGRDVVRVEHDQNANLRPNEKMIRSVCLDCHTLQQSLDALASPRLIDGNFDSAPLRHVRSIDMALARERAGDD